MMAVGAIRARRPRALGPGDVAVVGFDDIGVAELLSPPLTTIRQDMVGIGLAAGRALVEQIENPDVTPPVLTLPVELVVRASCGAHGARLSTHKGGGSNVNRMYLVTETLYETRRSCSEADTCKTAVEVLAVTGRAHRRRRHRARRNHRIGEVAKTSAYGSACSGTSGTTTSTSSTRPRTRA